MKIYLLLLLCFSSLPSISEAVFTSEASIGRNLLQAKKPCSVNFEFMNYTILTSSCKGPSYPADICCQAFKDFACPYAKDLNDLSNECSPTMFNYINLYGHYPPGLFASLCRDDKVGLICPALAPGTGNNNVGNASNSHFRTLSLLPTLAAGLLFFSL